ncbi:Permease of the drug/metabolite transporter (DMT) superfamily [Desulfuromusa kysingii]|uniref:Permease of the drug/metabolite transporter (DMT) superfamily n=1 Tax=Desulfuromusa kysingii TaxID=37625 RepID=A0A1H3VHS5_9BACT|nr:DMT family transporter [Desulfuromusa kysingii]SDZ74327.1 Permease of the drug/metabolite transporter (DMT) superfamily [Desulfuromusa kysingii]
MSSQTNLSVYLKLLLMALFWGGTFIAGRFLAGEIDAFSAAFLRFTIAATVLLVITLRSYKRLPSVPRQQWFPLFILGLSGVFAYNFFFFRGLQVIEAGRAAVIIANNPIVIAVFAAIFFGEKLNTAKILGVILSVCGAIVVITEGHPTTILYRGIGTGELYIFGCVISWVTYSLVGRAAMRNLSPLVAVTYSAVIGAVLLFPAACLEGLAGQIKDYPMSVWLSLLYLGLCGTVVAFVWYYQGIQKIGSTRAGQFINFVPISAILLSAWLLDEPLRLSLLSGVLLVSSGVYLTNRR